jgi:hypothetical protein
MQPQEGRKIRSEIIVFVMNRHGRNSRLPSLANCPLELKRVQSWYLFSRRRISHLFRQRAIDKINSAEPKKLRYGILSVLY